jgi:hypothetical protein
LGKYSFSLVELSDQKEAPDLDVSRMCSVNPVAMLFERRPRRIECFRWPAQVARDERNLSLGDDAPRARHGLFHIEGTCSASQESLGSGEIAELRHGDASKREPRRVLA